MMETNQTTPPPPASGSGPMGSPEFQTTSASTQAPRKSTAGNPFLTPGSLVLAALCLAGFVALYVLSKRSGPQSAMGGQTLMYAKVDAALNMMASPPSSVELTQQTNAKAIVDQFYTAAKQRQVERKLLQRNPFIFKQEVPETTKIEVPKATPKVDKVQDELKAALAAARQLKLQTVLVGNNPAALISDSLVTTGQTIRGWKVTKIERTRVELTWKDQKHVLEMPR